MVDFDPTKDALNIRDHRVSLKLFNRVDPDSLLVGPDELHSDDEKRYIAYGLIDGLLYQAVLTYRGDEERIISLRAATRQERKWYGKAIRQAD